jgi:hypothetical protein
MHAIKPMLTERAETQVHGGRRLADARDDRSSSTAIWESFRSGFIMPPFPPGAGRCRLRAGAIESLICGATREKSDAYLLVQ